MRRIASISRTCAALAAAALLFAGALPAQAQTKIATVDMKKVFDGYYKTKQGTARLQEDRTAAKKALDGMYEDYRKANEERQKIIDSAADPVISSEERERRKKNAEQKLVDLKEIERSIGQFNRDSQERLELQMRRMREEIIRKIREVVNSKARAANYAFVFDISGESINQVPIILFANGQEDLTDQILSEMNAGAPAGILDAPASTGDVAPLTPGPGNKK